MKGHPAPFACGRIHSHLKGSISPSFVSFHLKSNYITPQGAKRLRDELEFLWRTERPRITREVSDAAAEGDRSENAAYIYGKKRLREIDRRVRFLSKRLDALTVVTPEPRSDSRVYFGAWVRLVDEEDREVEYQLVGPDEFDVKRGMISVDSPVGKAVMGKNVGDVVTVRRPAGVMEYEIVGVTWKTAEN